VIGFGTRSVGARRPLQRPAWHAAATSALALLALLIVAPTLACKASSSSSGDIDGGRDAAATDAGPPACSIAADAGAPSGVADDFGPNAKAGAASSALGQLNVYEVTSPRQLEWVDLYLRADLAGTRLTIAVYEAAARNATFRRLATVQVEVSPCLGWVGTGPLGIPLEPGRFYAIGFDPNQAVTTFVDSESNDLPIDGQFGRLIGSETATSVSLDALDWGKPSDKSFTRQRLFTSPRATDGGVTDASGSPTDASRDALDGGALDARG
jgi:hypothetical protein